ncbi:MAG: CPBP family intramembrane glutamic endopeptidase [Chryseolinea sp.]
MVRSLDPKVLQLLRVIFYWLFTATLLIGGISLSGVTFSKQTHQIAYGIWGSALVLFITWVFIKFERKTLKEYWISFNRKTMLKFLIGLVLGMGAIGILILLLIVFRKYEIHLKPQMPRPSMFLWYLAIIPASFIEEVVFRSYSFVNLTNTLGLRIAQALTAIAFAMYHVPFGWTISEALLGPGVWSLIFGIAAMYSKGIAMATGVHVGVNVIQSLVAEVGIPDPFLSFLKLGIRPTL